MTTEVLFFGVQLTELVRLKNHFTKFQGFSYKKKWEKLKVSTIFCIPEKYFWTTNSVFVFYFG